MRSATLLLVVLTVAPAVAQTTAVPLRVVADRDATPLRRVKVIAVTGGRAAAPVFTNDEGRVDVAGLAGSAVLQVSKAGFAPLAIAVSAQRVPLDVRLKPAAVITGRVVDTRGQPAVRVGVVVRRIEPTPATQDATAIRAETRLRTDDRGEFRAGNLIAGRYELYTERGYDLVDLPPGVSDAAAERGRQASQPLSGTVAVAADPGEPVDAVLTHGAPSVEFAFTEGGVITGTLTDEHGEPAEGYRVTLRPLGETGPFHIGVTAVTDDRGHYRVFQVPPGRYLVMAMSGDVPELAPRETWPALPIYYPGRVNPVEAVALTVERGGDTSGTNMVVPTIRGARVFGRVSPASAGAEMRISLTPLAAFRTAVIDVYGTVVRADGSFELTNLPPGNYAIKVLSPVVYDRPSPQTEFSFASSTLSVTDEDVGPLLLAPGATSTIRGRITFEGDRSGPALHDVRLSVLPVDGAMSPDPGMTRGAMAMAAGPDPGEWRFRISALSGLTRFGLPRAPQGWWLKSFRIGGVDAAIEPAQFGETGDSRDDVEIVLASTGATIAGRLTGQDRQSVDVYTVIAFSTDRDRWFEGSAYVKSTTSRSDGSFIVPTVPPGDYYVVALPYSELDPTADELLRPDALAGLTSSAQRITAGERQTARLDLRLLPLTR